MKLLLVVAAALIDHQGRVLITQRPEGRTLAGLWEFPGGKIEVGETPEQALQRELQEELGIVIKGQDLQPLTFASHAYEDFHLLMPLYICHTWQGRAKAREGQDLAWVDPDRLHTYAMPPADAPLIAPLVKAFR